MKASLPAPTYLLLEQDGVQLPDEDIRRPRLRFSRGRGLGRPIPTAARCVRRSPRQWHVRMARGTCRSEGRSQLPDRPRSLGFPNPAAAAPASRTPWPGRSDIRFILPTPTAISVARGRSYSSAWALGESCCLSGWLESHCRRKCLSRARILNAFSIRPRLVAVTARP